MPGDTYDYADLSGAERRFGTIDYSEDTPLLFKGQETTLKELGISINLEPRRQTKVKVEKLNCSNCGGPLNLVAPDQAERIVCPNCGGVHDVTAEGNLKFLEALKQHGPKPLVPLGAKGKVGDVEYVVAGFMQRSVTYDIKYYWTEYLLYNAKAGFRWLVDSDGNVERRRETMTPLESQDALLAGLDAAVEDLMDERVVGLGFGIPSRLDQRSGTVQGSRPGSQR